MPVESQLGELLIGASPEWIAVILAGVSVLLLLVLLRQSRAGNTHLTALLREEYRLMREAASRDVWELRDDVASLQNTANQLLLTSVAELGRAQRDGLNALEQRVQQQIERHESHQEILRQTMERRIGEFQGAVDGRLEQMRVIVDEKLQSTLERRIGESFRQVGERLEAVQKGLGEMQSLATGVSDLKRVLTNVKSRGTWGEVQLGALLEDILTPDQYARNVNTREGSRNVVEFAVRLPGDDGDVWLPIDAKFPQEDYQRLQEAAEAADQQQVEACTNALVRSVKSAAREIADKYLDPPGTTDFAILFLATEGLHAEVLRQSGLVEILQREHRVVVAGPTSLAAILNSLRMGFRTLAIEQRSSEVWTILATVKTEFERFGQQLSKARRQLDIAARAIDQTGTRTRAMARKLREVEHLPGDGMIAFSDPDDEPQVVDGDDEGDARAGF